MEFTNLLEKKSAEIIESALASLNRAHLKSYTKSTEQKNRSRLMNLLSLTRQCIKEKNLLPITEYSEKIAKERYKQGFDLFEVHTAFNVLEEVLWKRVVQNIEPQKLGEALGFISTVLGTGKETLALTYVALASKHKTKTLNLEELFNR